MFGKLLGKSQYSVRRREECEKLRFFLRPSEGYETANGWRTAKRQPARGRLHPKRVQKYRDYCEKTERFVRRVWRACVRAPRGDWRTRRCVRRAAFARPPPYLPRDATPDTHTGARAASKRSYLIMTYIIIPYSF